MQATLIICTHNRCETLARALQSVSESRMRSDSDWEVLVVDNGSQDRTREVVEGLMNRKPGLFTYLFEPRRGKSHALNTGIQHARGEILVFTDDDLTFAPTWLANLISAFQEQQWAGAGGRTLPILQAPIPRWLALNGLYGFGGILAAVFDLGDQPCQLKKAPFGANMAYRRAMFEKYGGFRTDLGPGSSAKAPRTNEDTEFGRRLMRNGELLLYVPNAVAYHPLITERVNKRYCLEWWFDHGRACARESLEKPAVFSIPRRHLRSIKAVVTLLVPSFVKWMCARDPVRRFYMRCHVWTAMGQIFEWQHEGKFGRNQPMTPLGSDSVAINDAHQNPD